MGYVKLSHVKTVLFHLIFWVGVWFFYVYFFSYNSDNTVFIKWFSSFLLPLTMAVSYFMVYYLIPKFLLTKKYFHFALYSFYTLIFTSYIIVIIIYGFLMLMLTLTISNMPPMSKNFFFILILVSLVVGLISFVSILNLNFKTVSSFKELQNKILSTQLQLKNQEVKYLKMQIHPHFLFNTLNTIYGLALKRSEQTPEVILLLSNLLDYILYQVDKPSVSLSEEVNHVKEYIELEKIRFKDTLRVNFNAGQINEMIQVAPMMLIPFVENAFKHGRLVNGLLSIEVNVKVESNNLYFAIGNSCMDDDVEPEAQRESGGIGLENIQKRLELNYPNRYKLVTSKTNRWYLAELTIYKIGKTNEGKNNTMPDS